MFLSTFVRVFSTLLAIFVFFILIIISITFLNISDISNQKSNFKHYSGNKDSSNKIVVMKLSGPIIHSNYSINQFSSFNYINPEDIKKNLEQLKKINAKILIVSINSPGGTVSASNEIYEILTDYKKNNQIKIYFYTNNVLASGAYWAAMSADKIYANYGALIGSIGVKGPDWIYYDEPIAISSGLLGSSIETKKGIRVFSQSAGKSKDFLNPFRKPKENELNHMQKLVNEIYDDFIRIVSKKRSLEKNYLKEEIGAFIFNSKEAKKNFLIDEELTLAKLIKTITINNFKDYEIIEIENNYDSFLEKFLVKSFSKFQNKNNIFEINLICGNLKTNFISILPNYFLNC